MLKRSMPLCFVRVIVNWYSKLKACVRWKSAVSNLFEVKSGVRQGGILSPLLFNVYINCIIVKLRNTGLGCWIKSTYLGCIVYADDILLLSSSCIELQKMLNICNESGCLLGIAFNAAKCKCIQIGPNLMQHKECLRIGNNIFNRCDAVIYLVVTIRSHK